jgi:spermidine synthase
MRQIYFVTLCFAFLLSGAAGLIYQVAWTRYLTLIVGGSGKAQVIVLATFMGGLGLGAWLLGRTSDRVRSPLRLFILLEVAITLYAYFFPGIFFLTQRTYFGLLQGQEPGTLLVSIGKVVVSVLLILPPSILMGGTLPVLSRFIIQHLSLVERRVSQLYYVNSAGAVVGSLVAGFWLISRIGLPLTVWVGASLDLIVTIIAIILAATGMERLPPLAGQVDQDDAPANDLSQSASDAPLYPARIVQIALGIITVSGAVSMMYEVSWIRMLAHVLGSSHHSYALMVATFILGITLGSFFISFKKNPDGAFPLLGYLQFAIAAAILITLPFYMELPYWLNQLQGGIQRTRGGFILYQVILLFLCGSIMLLPTIFIGMTLPVASQVAARGVKSLGGDIGGVFGLNTLGTLIGAAITGVVFIPMLGVANTLLLAVTLNVALGIVILVTAPEYKSSALKVGLIGGVVLLHVAGSAFFMYRWNPLVLINSTFRDPTVFPTRESYNEYVTESNLLYYEDGIDSSVSVTDVTEGSFRTLAINGKTEASAGYDENGVWIGDMPTQLLVAHMPLMLHPEPKRVLLVGMGSGITAGAVLGHPGVELDIVELSPQVGEAARFFDKFNHDFLDDPRVTVYYEDARTFLNLTDKKYDVIINEPSNPWMGGAASLFTNEYFLQCKEHLNPDGFILQWIHYYETNDATIINVISTFRATFPYLNIWEFTYGDLAIIGSANAWQPDLDRLTQRMQYPGVQDDLLNLGLEIPEVLLQLQILDVADSGTDIMGWELANSDFLPALEFDAQYGFFISEPAPIVAILDQRSRLPQWSNLWVHHYERPAELPSFTAERWNKAYEAALSRDSFFPAHTRYVLREWQQFRPDDPWVEFNLMMDAGSIGTLGALRRIRDGEYEGIEEEPRFIFTILRLLEDYIAEDYSADEDLIGLAYWSEWARRYVDRYPSEAWRFHRIIGNMEVLQQNYPAAREAFSLALAESEQQGVNYNVLEGVNLLRFLTSTLISEGQWELARIALQDYEPLADFFSTQMLRDRLEREEALATKAE